MKIRTFFTRKRIIWGIVILLVIGGVGYKVLGPKNNSQNILTETVKKQDLKQTVLATGEVTSSTDLNLSFKASGIVRQINVKVGDKVSQGNALATLDQKDQLAALTSARGVLAQAQANYDKILAGATNEQIQVAQTNLDNAKKSLEDTRMQQQILVDNARRTFLNSGIAAVPAAYNSGGVTITITGIYQSDQQGVYNISLYDTGLGRKFKVTGLESSEGQVNSSGAVPLGTGGLYLQFSSVPTSVGDTWIVEIPNTRSSVYLTNKNAYDTAVETQRVALNNAQSAVNSAQAQLDLQKAQARPVDLDVVAAQVLSAQGQVQAAQASFENTILRAPTSGTITSVDIKTGELATGLKEAVILQDIDNLHLEANVSEANVADIKQGQTIDVTFDALSPDEHVPAIVQLVDPASTVISGVVNYKITATINKIPEIKPGMTANMTILTNQKTGVLAVPQRAIIQNDTKKIVRVVTNTSTKTYVDTEVTTGITADGGLVEILSGLKEGQEIVTFINK